MKNKRKIKKFQKLWFLAPLGLASVIIPITLTSCANISQYVLPITTTNPFSTVLGTTKDFFGHEYNSYIPQNFITYINRSASNSVTGYGYMNPQDIKNIDGDKFKNFGYGYYGSNDQKLAYYDTNDKNNTVKSYQNANLSIASGTTSSLSATFSSLIQAMVHFISQTGITCNDTYRGKWIDYLLNTNNTTSGDAWHGQKGGDEEQDKQNKKFFEFLFDLNNLLSVGNVPYRFDLSSQAFNFKINPFLDKDNCGGAKAFSFDQPRYNAYTNKNFTLANADTQVNKDVKAYASYAECANADTDGTKYNYLSNFAYSIPSLVSLSNSDLPISQFTYYNPLKNLGFSPNQYLDIDMNKVVKGINHTNAWKAIDKLIGDKSRDKYGINQAFGISTSNDAMDIPSGLSDGDYEPALNRILEQQSYNASDFLVMNAYTVLSYKLPTDHIPGVDDNPDGTFDPNFYEDVTDLNGKDNDGNEARNVHIPIFYGTEQNIYPVALLFKNIDFDTQNNKVTLSNFDTDLLKKKTQAIYLDPTNNNNVRDGYDGDEYKLEYLDLDKLNDKFAKFMTFITTMVQNNTDPDNYKIKYKGKNVDETKDYYYRLFKMLLGNVDSNHWLTILK